MQAVFINNNQNGFHHAPVCDSIMSEMLKTKNAADRIKKIRRNGTNVRQKYRSVWIDDMSTTMVTSEGDADTNGKVIILGGDYACAMTGEKHKEAKQIYRIISHDKHVFEMHDPTKGDNSKTMEITYTRK